MFRIALALLVLSSSVSDAAIFDRDDRMAATLNPVGIVTGGEHIYYGSGFLIDRCDVLTARHVAGAPNLAVEIGPILPEICIFLEGGQARSDCQTARQAKTPRLTSSVLATINVTPNR